MSGMARSDDVSPAAGLAAAEEFPPELRRGLPARDPAALARFFDLYFDRVYGYVRRLTGDEHLAEDLTQDVFLQVQRALPSYDPERDPRPWVFTIATNKLRDHWRARATQEGRAEESLDRDDLIERLPSLGASPSGELTEAELSERVRRAVDLLPEGLRVTVLLRVYENLSFEEIGRILQRNEVAARKRYSRALEALREVLGPAWRTHAEGAS